MLITAVICTYNRKPLLETQVATIHAMEGADSSEFEVVYVDNNSTDGSFEELQRLLRDRPRFRVVREERQGVSHARNRGAKEARGTFIWNMDDDSLPHPGALASYMDALPKWNPEVATGPIYPVANIPIPWWFKMEAKELNAYLARTDFGGETRWLVGGHAWGPNLAVRRDALEAAGGFDVSLGVSGEKRGGMEEDELTNRLLRLGGRLLYVHDAAVDHLVVEKQVRFRYYLRQRLHRGSSEGQGLAMQGTRRDGVLGTAARIAGHFGLSALAMARGRVASSVDHFGACVGLYGKWAGGRSYARGKRSGR